MRIKLLRRVHTARYESDATRRWPCGQQLHACLFVAERAVTDGTALDRSQSRKWLDFGSGRERFRPSPRVQPQINKRVAADRAARRAASGA